MLCGAYIAKVVLRTVEPDRGHLSQAGKLLDRALALDPQHRAANLLKSEVHMDWGQYPAALGCVQAAMRALPGDVVLQVRLGKVSVFKCVGVYIHSESDSMVCMYVTLQCCSYQSIFCIYTLIYRYTG